jgi:transcriptional regulator of acetoin/glycerol metabolism
VTGERQRTTKCHGARRDLCETAKLTVRDLPTDMTHQPPLTPDLGFTIRPGVSLKEVQAELLFRTLESVDGNKARAARILGNGRRSIYALLERHGRSTEVAPSSTLPKPKERNGLV